MFLFVNLSRVVLQAQSQTLILFNVPYVRYPASLIVSQLENVCLQHPLGVLHWMASWSQGMHKSFFFLFYLLLCTMRPVDIRGPLSVALLCHALVHYISGFLRPMAILVLNVFLGCFSRLVLYFCPLPKKKIETKQIDHSLNSDSQNSLFKTMFLIYFLSFCLLHCALSSFPTSSSLFIELFHSTRLPFKSFVFFSTFLLAFTSVR